METIICARCGAENLAGHEGPCPTCGTADEWAALGLFDSPSTGPRNAWDAVLAPIENPTTAEEYSINRHALSAVLKEARRRREAGEPRQPVDLYAELRYLVAATGYLDPETFNVIEQPAPGEPE